MPYINTQHPSNTRTTVTMVLSIIFGVSIIPYTAFGALYFELGNADVPTIYTQVKVKIRKGGNNPNNDPAFESTDVVYFIEDDGKAESAVTDNKAQCNNQSPITKCCVNPPETVTQISVTPSSQGVSAGATVDIKTPDFAVGKKYKMCYFKKKSEAGQSTVHDASSSILTTNGDNEAGVERAVPFTVLGMFTKYAMTPNTVYEGQGPVTLTITDYANAEGNAMSERKFIQVRKQEPFLIPCPNGCSEADKVASLCSKNVYDRRNRVKIKIDVVSGFGTGKLTTTFFAPLGPTNSYMICVPYCFKDGDSEESSCKRTTSWALVNFDAPISFQRPNPASYTINPISPQAGELTKITFTGTGLNNGDRIRIIPQGRSTNEQLARGEICPTSTAPMPGIEYTDGVPGAGTVKVAAADATTSAADIRLNAVIPDAITGQVCYSLAANPTVWAPVYKPGGTSSDLEFTPIQPSGFTILPDSPVIGQELQVTFTGEGLSAQDSAYLLKCPAESNKPPVSTEISLATCASDKSTKYCELSKDGNNFKCDVASINPMVKSSEWMRVCACYKKKNDPKHPKHFLVSGSVVLGAKIPPPTKPSEDGKINVKSVTDVSSTIPAVLITSVVFLYLYNW